MKLFLIKNRIAPPHPSTQSQYQFQSEIHSNSYGHSQIGSFIPHSHNLSLNSNRTTNIKRERISIDHRNQVCFEIEFLLLN